MAIPRINVLDYQALGQKFIGWVKDPSSRPKDLTEFGTQLAGIVDQVPSYIKSIMFVQATKDILLIRLPPAEMVQDTEKTIANGGKYQMSALLQTFYTDCADKNFYNQGTEADRKRTFECRVGDYSIALCW